MIRLLPLCLALFACAGALCAQDPAPGPRATTAAQDVGPGPQGSVNEEADVFVFGPGGWFEGRPGQGAWRTVAGGFELRGLPEAEASRATSVFLTRPGHFPIHRVVRPETPQPAAWGPLFFDPLLGGRAGLLVLVVEHEPGGIVRYLRHSVKVTNLDTQRTEDVVAASERGVRVNLAPGRYRLVLDTDRRFEDSEGQPQEISVRADQALPLVFALDAPGGASLPLTVEPPEDPRLRAYVR